MEVKHERPSWSAPVWMACGKNSKFGPRGQFLTDGDLDASIIPETIIPVSHQAHKNPSTPLPPSSFEVSNLVIACVAVIVVLLIVTAIAVIVRRRRRRHSYQQPKWLKVNKKIIM